MGRPRGTKTATVELETVSFKAPKEFVERVKRYAKQRLRPVSELVRDGLEWRIGEGDPLNLRDGTLPNGEPLAEGNIGITGIAGESVEVLRDLQAAVTRVETQLQAVMQMLKQNEGQDESKGNTGNTERAPRGDRVVQRNDKGNIGNTEHAPSTVLTPLVPRVTSSGDDHLPVPSPETDVADSVQDNTPAIQEEPAAPETAPTFDAKTFYLGELCPEEPERHQYAMSGKSVRYRADAVCRGCAIAANQTRQRSKASTTGQVAKGKKGPRAAKGKSVKV
jgi:hypothetical protein